MLKLTESRKSTDLGVIVTGSKKNEPLDNVIDWWESRWHLSLRSSEGPKPSSSRPQGCRLGPWCLSHWPSAHPESMRSRTVGVSCGAWRGLSAPVVRPTHSRHTLSLGRAVFSRAGDGVGRYNLTHCYPPSTALHDRHISRSGVAGLVEMIMRGDGGSRRSEVWPGEHARLDGEESSVEIRPIRHRVPVLEVVAPQPHR